jgi:hypothetical protein
MPVADRRMERNSFRRKFARFPPVYVASPHLVGALESLRHENQTLPGHVTPRQAVYLQD